MKRAWEFAVSALVGGLLAVVRIHLAVLPAPDLWNNCGGGGCCHAEC